MDENLFTQDRNLEKKGEIWLSLMTKAPIPTEKYKKTTWQHKNATKNFDYTMVTDRLRTVSWSNDIDPILPTSRKSHVIKRTPIQKFVNNSPYKDKDEQSTKAERP